MWWNRCGKVGRSPSDGSANCLSPSRPRSLPGCAPTASLPRRATIRKVAVLGGAGGDYLHPAAAAGADALVTGEAKHHEYLEAVRMGITLLDATHYATEQVVLRPLAEYLTACCPDVRFAVGCGGDALCFTGGCRG